MDGQTLALIITTIGGFATLVFKSMSDEAAARRRAAQNESAATRRYEQARQDRIDAAAEAKSEHEQEARAVRERLEASSRQLEAKATAVSDKVVAMSQATERHLDRQTEAIRKAIADAKGHLEMQSKNAFEASNDTNTKIAKLNARLIELSTVLASLVAAAAGRGGEEQSS